MPLAAAAPYLIMGGASAAGGLLGSRAANNAAQHQQAWSGRAIETIDNAVNQANPLLESAAATSSQGVVDTANDAAVGVTNAAAQAGQDLRVGAAEANDLLNPYYEAGNGALGVLSELLRPENQKFTFSQDDPSYQWRLQQGEQALQRSAALRGGLQSGAAMKAMTGYAQGMASQEYQNAFNRWNTSRSTTGTLASGLAGMGLNAGNRMGQNTLSALTQQGDWNTQAAGYAGNMRSGAAQYAGNMNFNQAMQRGQNTLRGATINAGLLDGIGDSRAAATIGAANAWGGAINGVANAAAGYFSGGRVGGGTKPRYQLPGGVYDSNGNYIGE